MTPPLSADATVPTNSNSGTLIAAIDNSRDLLKYALSALNTSSSSVLELAACGASPGSCHVIARHAQHSSALDGAKARLAAYPRLSVNHRMPRSGGLDYWSRFAYTNRGCRPHFRSR
jgi:hypothetical protein